MKILFVDDIRIATDVTIARSYTEAIDLLNQMEFDVISLDHDLGEEKTGYDIAKYIVENQIPLKGFRVHSANPVGVFNIRQLLTHYGYKEIY